jgi:hypothetical protein
MGDDTVQYPRLHISRGRWEERPDVWICGWLFDYRMEDGTCLIVHSQEDEPSEDEMRELSIEYECPVSIDRTRSSRGVGGAL